MDRYFDIIFDADLVDQVPLGDLFESDERRRRLEREVAQGGPRAQARLWREHNRNGDTDAADALSRTVAKGYQQTAVDVEAARLRSRNAGETQLRHPLRPGTSEAHMAAKREVSKRHAAHETSTASMREFFRATEQNPGIHMHPDAPKGEGYKQFNHHVSHVADAYPSSKGVSVGMSRNPVVFFDDPHERDQAAEAYGTHYSKKAVTTEGPRKLVIDAMHAAAHRRRVREAQQASPTQ